MTSTVIVDNREKKSGIPDMLIARDMNIVMRQLPVGDYLVGDRIIIERKTGSDFVQSIINGHLFDQCAKLKKSVEVSMIIVEGDPYKTKHCISPEAIKGTLLSISLSWQIPVMQSSERKDTASLIIMASQKAIAPSVFIRRQGIKPKKKQRQQHFFVQSLPGIGPALAQRLLNHFKTIERIVLADIKSLGEVEGIGKNKADVIYHFLRS